MEIQELHNKAMELADRADMLKRSENLTKQILCICSLFKKRERLLMQPIGYRLVSQRKACCTAAPPHLLTPSKTTAKPSVLYAWDLLVNLQKK